MEKLRTHGKYIPLSNVDRERLSLPELFRTEAGRFVCYYGYKPRRIAEKDHCFALSVAFRDGESLDSSRFIKLENGALIWGYEPNENLYHLPEMNVDLPQGTSRDFGVYGNDGVLDEEAARQIFGLLFEELKSLVECYEEAAGHQGQRKGRVTSSNRLDNICNLTGAYIPMNFPYVAFSKSGYMWSHVSIFGFYCHLAFLMKSGTSSPFYKRLYSVGVNEEILKRVSEIPVETQAIRVSPEKNFG